MKIEEMKRIADARTKSEWTPMYGGEVAGEIWYLGGPKIAHALFKKKTGKDKKYGEIKEEISRRASEKAATPACD